MLMCSTELSIALKDNSGLYRMCSVSLFSLNEITKVFPGVTFKKIDNKELAFNAVCTICGEEHRYIYSLGDLVKRDMLIGGCYVTGKPVFIIGKYSKIESFINRHNEISKQICEMML
jgi:hypothetical protein